MTNTQTISACGYTKQQQKLGEAATKNLRRKTPNGDNHPDVSESEPTSALCRWDFLSEARRPPEEAAAYRDSWTTSLRRRSGSRTDCRSRETRDVNNSSKTFDGVFSLAEQTSQTVQVFLPAMGVTVAVHVALTGAAGSRTLQNVFMHGQN